MNLKRFRGETVREALERARGELGPDALVLSTQLVRRVDGAVSWAVARSKSTPRSIAKCRNPGRLGRKSDNLSRRRSARWLPASRLPVLPQQSPGK